MIHRPHQTATREKTPLLTYQRALGKCALAQGSWVCVCLSSCLQYLPACAMAQAKDGSDITLQQTLLCLWVRNSVQRGKGGAIDKKGAELWAPGGPLSSSWRREGLGGAGNTRKKSDTEFRWSLMKYELADLVCWENTHGIAHRRLCKWIWDYRGSSGLHIKVRESSAYKW